MITFTTGTKKPLWRGFLTLLYYTSDDNGEELNLVNGNCPALLSNKRYSDFDSDLTVKLDSNGSFA